MTLSMILAATILSGTLLVFALGKSPLFRVDRAGAAIIGGILMIGIGILSFDQAAQAVDYRTILLLFSMMIITANLKLSGFFFSLGDWILSRARTQRRLLLIVIIASGLLSALFVNDIICLLFTPVVVLICRRVQINPLPYLIGLATASNIGSAGTLIGNPQNMLIAGLSHIPFAQYLLIAMPLTMIGLLFNYLLIAWFYRMDLRGSITDCQPIGGAQHPYLIRKSLIVMGIILLGVLAGGDAPLIAGLGAGFMLLTRRLKPNKVYASIDFNLLVIFIGLFVIINGVEHSGLMNWLLKSLGVKHLRNFSVFALLTLIFSNIFSNVPAVLLLKFLIPSGTNHLWWAGLAVFSTLAGNLTLVGSIANLIVAEMAKREGIELSFKEYFKVGFPLTLFLSGIALAYFGLLLR